MARPKAVTAGFGGEASGPVVPARDTRLYGRGLGAKRIYALRLGFLRYGVICNLPIRPRLTSDSWSAELVVQLEAGPKLRR